MVQRIPLAPVTWPAVFFLLAGVPLIALGWVGWRVLDQDRDLEIRRLHDGLENAASLAAHEIERSFVEWEGLLAGAARGEQVAVPPESVILVIDEDGVVARHGVQLPYYPRVAAPAPASTLFDPIESLELQSRDLARAETEYRSLARSTDQSTRAAALVRLARLLRQQHRTRDAVAVYDQLAGLGATVVFGEPAELLARHERGRLLHAEGNGEAASRELGLLSAALYAGRFAIDRATFDFYSQSLPTSPKNETPQLASAVDALWPAWERQPEGRAPWGADAHDFATAWRRFDARTVAIVGPMAAVSASAREIAGKLGAILTFEDASGRLVTNGETRTGVRVSRTSRETGLPWTLHLVPLDPAAAQARARGRRALFAVGFGLIVLVVGGSGYAVLRSVRRELGVARLQSDFVAAVSHEFRTPLTAMCHLTEMLEEGSADKDRLPHYYQALGRESRRLHTMVEQLLDFGRMDAGKRDYELVETDARDFVERVVQDCREHVPAAAGRIEWSPLNRSRESARVLADREALALALRNLLDNALKYSPAASSVKVSVVPESNHVAIAVEDQGPGVTKDERRSVFDKFARGSAAKAMNVKGTGIGLAMTNQIVRAHHGEVRLESEPGRGTTFTILLPELKAES